MEHRLSSRSESVARVFLYEQGVPVATGCLRNLSRNGCFIETEFTEFKVNQILELDIVVLRSCGQERMRAMLIHKNIQGLGFMLDTPNEVKLQKRVFE